MPRPEKDRFIRCRPGADIFKPAGVPARELEEVILTLDCYEAIRLVDLEGCDHAAAAERLGVSRPTLTRILKRGRNTIADALVHGKSILIEGGTVVWGLPPERIQETGPRSAMTTGDNGGGGRRRRGRREKR